MFKVAFIGAGSYGFTRTLVKDLLSIPEFQNTIEFAFHDISEQNLKLVYDLIVRDIEHNGLTNKTTSSTNRRESLQGARYIINCSRIGGPEAFEHDVMIPMKYGVDQCVGDTLCAGGIMYGQRGIAAMLDFCKDIREVSEPDALLLNYGNPNAMLTWAANKYGGLRCVGLCHGVQHGHWQIANALGAKDKSEVDMICAGINHQTWYISLKYQGRNITGEELFNAFVNHPDYSVIEKVRIDMLKRFGYYSTESNGHLSEYLPWYRKRPEEIHKWIKMGSWIDGESGGYLRVTKESRNWIENEYEKVWGEPPAEYKVGQFSDEHGSQIIKGLELGIIYRGCFNVVNNGIISNLPDDAIVEAPGYVDRNGINMTKVGDLPLGCAAVCNASISVQRLAVEAAVHADINLLRQAFMMDPLVGAVCNPPEIWQMVDEMLVALEEWLPQYKEVIKGCKERLADKSKLIPTKEGYKGAAPMDFQKLENKEYPMEKYPYTWED